MTAKKSTWLHHVSNHLSPSALVGLDLRTPLPPGVSLLSNHKPRVPPPPGEDNRDVRAVNSGAGETLARPCSLTGFSRRCLQSWQNEEMSVGGPKIPQALEKILQLKEIRQEQLTDPAGHHDDSFPLFHFARLHAVHERFYPPPVSTKCRGSHQTPSHAPRAVGPLFRASALFCALAASDPHQLYRKSVQEQMRK